MAETAVSPEANGVKKPLVKPEKPNEEQYHADLKRAEKEHADSLAKLAAIRSKLDVAKPTSKDSPSAKNRAELIAQLKQIREKQSAGKAGRNKVFDQIKKEDGILKDLIAQHKMARSRVNFKSVEDLDREIDRLDKQVNAGTMKIVDEKKALSEISNLRKQRKNFSGFEDAQKTIDAKKTLLKQLREQLDDPESKALADQYNKLQTQLDAIKAEQDEVFKNINTLRDERTQLQDDVHTKLLAIRTIKGDYYAQNRAVQKWEYEVRQRAREKKKADEEKYQLEKKKAHAQQVLADASDKAYLDEIRRAESLLRFLDPSYSAERVPLQAPSKFQATAQRRVDESGIEGRKVLKKEEEDYFAGTGGKKSKKGRKTNANGDAAAVGKYSCSSSVMEECTAMGIEPPMSAADIPAVKEKIQAKLDHWKADQDAQTQKNIARAKKELERLEAEESSELSHVNDDGSIQNEITLEESVEADAIADKE